MFAHQQRLGCSVTALLLEIRPNRRTAIVPNKRRWAESNFVPRLLQAPTNIHIVPGLAKDWIKATDRREGPFVKSHVAAGDMFGLSIREHHMRRAAW